MRPVHREGALADPGHPRDQDDARRRTGLLQPLRLGSAPHEEPGSRRQPSRRHRRRHVTAPTGTAERAGGRSGRSGLGVGGRVRPRGGDRAAGPHDRPLFRPPSHVLAQYAGVRRREFGARGEAQFTAEAPADALVRPQRLRLKAAGGQGQHQSGVQRLVEGIVRGGPAQGGQHLVGSAAQQCRVRRQPGRLQEFPLHGRELDVLAHRRRSPHRHRSSPLLQRQHEPARGRLGTSGGHRTLSLPGQLAETQQVDLLGGRLQEVAPAVRGRRRPGARGGSPGSSSRRNAPM